MMVIMDEPNTPRFSSHQKMRTNKKIVGHECEKSNVLILKAYVQVIAIKSVWGPS